MDKLCSIEISRVKLKIVVIKPIRKINNLRVYSNNQNFYDFIFRLS